MTTQIERHARSRKAGSVRTVLALLLAGAGLAATTGAALADPPWQHDGWHRRGGDERRGWYGQRPGWHQGWAPPPAYYAPPPPPPPPVYYAPPPPAYYGPPNLSFGVTIPLNR